MNTPPGLDVFGSAFWLLVQALVLYVTWHFTYRFIRSGQEHERITRELMNQRQQRLMS